MMTVYISRGRDFLIGIIRPIEPFTRDSLVCTAPPDNRTNDSSEMRNRD